MSDVNAQPSNKIIRLGATIEKTGLSRSSIYLLLSRGQFPPRIKLSERSMGFLESEVEAWIRHKADSRSA